MHRVGATAWCVVATLAAPAIGACGAEHRTTVATLPAMMGSELRQAEPLQQSAPPVPTQTSLVGAAGAVGVIDARLNAAFAGGQFPTMLWMLTASGVLAEIGSRPVTILAADEQAFREFAVLDIYGLLQNPTALAPVLRRHVLDGVYTYDQLATVGSVTNLAGERLGVWTNGRMVEVNDVVVSPPIGDETIQSAAVMADSGVEVLAASRIMLAPPGTG